MEVSGQLHASAGLLPGTASRTHWIGGWVGPRAGLDAVVKRKFPSPCRDSDSIGLNGGGISRPAETLSASREALFSKLPICLKTTLQVD
jgi:hypothetical protein